MTDITDILRRTLAADCRFQGSVREFREWLLRRRMLLMYLEEGLICWGAPTS